jgi:two-component system, cell cycle response regulator DivK
VARAVEILGNMIPTILVVEDNPMNLELVRDVLTSASMKVVGANTAQEGLAAASEIKPDLILLDIRLPGMDGYAMLERLRGNSLTASIPVVALTAQAMVGDREQALAAGFSEYIPKPIDTRTLAAQVRALLGPAGARRRAGGKGS